MREKAIATEYTLENRCVCSTKQLLAPQMRCFHGEEFQFNAVMVTLIGIFSATTAHVLRSVCVCVCVLAVGIEFPEYSVYIDY